VLDGPGTLVLSGTNSYTGGTTVEAGTLIVTSNTALPDGSSLTVGAGGTFLFDPSAAGSPVANSSATVAVPEPGTLALLIAGLAVVFGVWRSRRGFRLTA
jgi:autotransporter-associated beta strand protein